MGIHPRQRDANRRTIIDMLETTPAAVARPPATPVMGDPLPDLDFDWRPRPMEPAVSAPRTFRWSILGAAMVLGVIALLGVRVLVTVPQEKADVRRAEYQAALDDFERALDTFAAAPNPSSPSALAAFADAADSLGATARASLPSVIPLLPIGPIEELRPARSEMLRMVDAVESMVTDLAAAASYREAAAQILALPLLPGAAPAELIDPAARAIADMQSTTQAAFGRLDDDPTFATYRERAGNVIAGLSDWSDRYLLALRRGDLEATAAALAEMQGRIALVNAALEAAVADRDDAARATIASLRTALAEARVKLA